MFEYARITVQTSFQFNFVFFQLVKIILFVKMLIHISVLFSVESCELKEC